MDPPPARWTPLKAGCSCNRLALSPHKVIPGSSENLIRKENSSQDSGWCLLGHFALPPILNPNAGILTCFPFALRTTFMEGLPQPIAHFLKLLTRLGLINPWPTAVLMEPFSTSTFKVLTWIFATTTKICTKESYTPGHPWSCFATFTFVYSLKFPG